MYSGTKDRLEAKEVGGERVSLENLLEESDFVVVCCTLNSETAGMFNQQRFSQMKKSAIFINSARFFVACFLLSFLEMNLDLFVVLFC